MSAPPRLRLLARLLVASATTIACQESSDTAATGERQNSGGQGGSAQGGQGGSAQAGQGGSAQASSGGSTQAGQGGAQGGQGGCAGQAPTCEMKCSDAWPPASCLGSQWVCPSEPANPDCQPLGGLGGGAGAGGGLQAGAGGVAQAGAGGVAQAGAGGGGPYAPCGDGSFTCSIVACYPRAEGEPCLEPNAQGLADKLQCEPNTPYPFYVDQSKPTECCYGAMCPGGRPLLVEGALTLATAASRGDWG